MRCRHILYFLSYKSKQAVATGVMVIHTAHYTYLMLHVSAVVPSLYGLWNV